LTAVISAWLLAGRGVLFKQRHTVTGHDPKCRRQARRPGRTLNLALPRAARPSVDELLG
jgi:hypothetical protein